MVEWNEKKCDVGKRMIVLLRQASIVDIDVLACDGLFGFFLLCDVFLLLVDLLWEFPDGMAL